MKKHQKNILVFFACLGIAIANGYFFNLINDRYFKFSTEENGLKGFSAVAKFGLIIIAAPLIETFFFNFVLNLTLRELKIRSMFWLVLIPSIVFSLAHFYNFLYALMAFAGAIIMNWYYIHSQSTSKYAFWLVVLLHASYNLFGFLFIN